MDNNSKIVSTYNVVQTESSDLYFMDPMTLISLIFIICLILYIVRFR